MHRNHKKLFLALGAGAIGLVALESSNAGGLLGCWCDRDRCHTPPCRELCRRPPGCDCRFGHFTTEWAPWGSNCPPDCAPNNEQRFEATPYVPSPEWNGAMPEPVPGNNEPPLAPSPDAVPLDQSATEQTSYLPPLQSAPRTESAPLPEPEAAFKANPVRSQPIRMPMRASPIPPQPEFEDYPLPMPPSTEGPAIVPSPRSGIQIPQSNEFAPPMKSDIPADSAYWSRRRSVQPTGHWQQPQAQPQFQQPPVQMPNTGNTWRVMPGYHGVQPQQPVMSQPFYGQ